MLAQKDSVPEEIVSVTRGERTHVYRVRLLEDGSASLERFENGAFSEARLLRGGPQDGFDAREQAGPEKLKRAVRYAIGYLDGSVNVGERDLLSPTSALTRNVRWFPGDIQMLNTAFHYVRELFPSAQFHVTQLFRRVFGDVAFLALIALTSAFWLKTQAHSGAQKLALALQLVSMIAIIGFDRFWEPIRYRFQKVRELRFSDFGARAIFELPWIVVSQIASGIVAVTINTLIGLTNLVINPLKIFMSWRQVGRGKTLEWKASSTSAGQDMRGWPLIEFLDVYGPAAKVGLGLVFCALALICVGAPLELLGLNSIGVFVASFLTAWLFAWYAALPRTADSGAPQYALSRSEYWGMTLGGALGLGISVGLFALGLYPAPAFEKSVGWLALFLTASSAFAAVYPTYYQYKRRVHRLHPAQAEVRLRRLNRLMFGSALVGASVLLIACLAFPGSTREIRQFLASDPALFRVSEAERNVYAQVAAAVKAARFVEPEPVLRSENDQVTLSRTKQAPTLDVGELQGIPAPRPPRLASPARLALPELSNLPADDRIPSNRPRREYVLPAPLLNRPRSTPQAASHRPIVEARRRIRLAESRKLSTAEQAAQRSFIESADYPWISQDELQRLGTLDERGVGVPLLEMARVYRFDDVKALWDRVDAVKQRAASPRARFSLLLEGIDGAVSIGEDPSPENVQRFLETEFELADTWSREYPNLPLTALPGETGERANRVFAITRLLLQHGLTARELATKWRLDYVNAHWDAAPNAPGLRHVFRERAASEAWETFEIDFGENNELRSRWEGLQTEQLVASAALGKDAATQPFEHLAIAARLLDGAIDAVGGGHTPDSGAAGQAAEVAGARLNTALRELLILEGVDRAKLARGDGTTAILLSRLRTQNLSARIGHLARALGSKQPLPGDEDDRQLLTKIARSRFGFEAPSPEEQLTLNWLVLIDASETYREVRAGYDKFQAESAERGLRSEGLPKAPALSDEQIWKDLLFVWRELPKRFPNLPAQADLVAEFLSQTAYLSSRDGKEPRSVAQFMEDFAALFQAVDARMSEAPPEELQRLADANVQRTQGRVSKSPAARRFFAWWQAGTLNRTINYNLARRSANRHTDLSRTAQVWAEVLSGGKSRYPHLPWESAGFSEFFVSVMELEAWEVDQLWERFDPKLARAERLLNSHVVPFEAFELVVDRRIAEKTGAPSLDRTLRQTNATLALVDLLEVAEHNGIQSYTSNPASLTRDFVELYEKLSKAYPNLYWHAEGAVESYLMRQLIEGWSVQRTLDQFDPELSLADALAAHGAREHFERLAGEDPSKLSRADRALRTFIDAQASRLEKKSGAKLTNLRARAMNGLTALGTLLMSAGEEGLLPDSFDAPAGKSAIQAWARRQDASTFDRASRQFALSLAQGFGELLEAMRSHGPAFPWEDGSFVEAELFVIRKSGADLPTALPALGPTWKTASELVSKHLSVPDPFTLLVMRDARADLRQKLARELGVSVHQVPEAELLAREEPELFGLNALLVLSNVVAQLRAAYQEEPNAVEVARAIVQMRAEGPKRYPHLPWSAKGFVPSLLIGGWRPEFRQDFWRYASLIDLGSTDALLAEAERRGRQLGEPTDCTRRGRLAWALPCEVLKDVRNIMREHTGRTPTSDDVVAFQALRDGSSVLKEFFPSLDLDLDNSLAVARVRAQLRALDARYPALHIVTAKDQTARVGFSERLTAIAIRLELASGHKLSEPDFPERAVRSIEQKYLLSMSRIYALIGDSFFPGELEYFARRIEQETMAENAKRAARYDVPESALSIPDVKDDDVISDFALYEILYADEIGQDREYVVQLLGIFNLLRRRPEILQAHQQALLALDRPYVGKIKAPGDRDYAAWLGSPEYRTWSEERGQHFKRARGKLLALSRSFALLKRAAFSEASTQAARSAFAPFGSFERYLNVFFDNMQEVRRVPEFKAVLAELEREDAFLADGVEFAVALFKTHVLDRSFGAGNEALARARSFKALQGIGLHLPYVQEDYRRMLGFMPGLESGVPFYDSFSSWMRASIEGGTGTDFLRRLNMVQRGVQNWTSTFVLKRAYKILFDVDLDEDDPTRLAATSAVERIVPRTAGDEVSEFLDKRLPSILERETGTRDLSTWLSWLMQHGELGLDGKPTGKNAYLETVRSYEGRIREYRSRIQDAEVKGRSARAEEQRLRDLEREYRSFQAQLTKLQDTARQAPALSRASSQEYTLALRQVSAWLVLLGVGLLLRAWSKRNSSAGARKTLGFGSSRRSMLTRLSMASLSIASIALPLALAVLPIAVVVSPSWAARMAGKPLQTLALLSSSDPHTALPRGAAAQLDKTRPWAPLGTLVASGGRER